MAYLPQIMIVEDNDDIRVTLAHIFKLEGYDVVSAQDGQVAWNYLKTNSKKPNLIFLDLMMPHMDGWTLQKKLKAEPKLAQIPVIVLTCTNPESDNPVPMQTTEYLTKPTSVEKLLNLARRHCPPA